MNYAVQPAKQIDASTGRKIQWTLTGNAETPYIAAVDAGEWRIQVNDFPAEALYTLFIDGQPAGELEEWPAAWQRPS